jgi:dipeptidyl aminopeptidase/acylaminoacyl peptidase
MAQAIDNKDRWIATVDLAAARLKPVHRLSDAAWVNYPTTTISAGCRTTSTLWYQSEESGYAHLYAMTADGRRVRSPPANGKPATSNGTPTAAPPTCSATASCRAPMKSAPSDAGTARLREVTSLGGVESFALSPDGRKLLVRYSAAYMPTQIATVPAAAAPPSS